MSDTILTVIGLLLPLVGTTLGASMAFVLRGEMRPNIQKAFLGFASGVMIAASVWSLLIPAIDAAEGGKPLPRYPTDCRGRGSGQYLRS